MTYREHCNLALRRCPDLALSTDDVQAILAIATMDAEVELITGGFHAQFVPPDESLIRCWNAVKRIVRSGDWRNL